MDRNLRDRAIRALRRGDKCVDIARNLGIQVWDVQTIQSELRCPVTLGFEPGDQVRIINSDTIAKIRRVYPDWLLLSNGMRVSSRKVIYEPTEDELERRKKAIRDASISMQLG